MENEEPSPPPLLLLLLLLPKRSVGRLARVLANRTDTANGVIASPRIRLMHGDQSARSGRGKILGGNMWNRQIDNSWLGPFGFSAGRLIDS
jgi:hypothetical protein